MIGAFRWYSWLQYFLLLVCMELLFYSEVDASSFAEPSKNNNSAPQLLKLLTWNIWMMPPLTFQSPKNSLRAQAISRCLLKEDFDIICLEKVFDCGARRILAKALSSKYPFQYGPANAAWSILPFKPVSSGVWVLSRIPLTDRREIEFSHCSSWECFSRKGAIFLAGRFRGRPFQLIATHLQGDEEPYPTAANDAIRLTQMQEIETNLLEPLKRPRIPVLMCGDFCTARRYTHPVRRGACGSAYPGAETPCYREMLQTLRVRNGRQDRITLNDNRDCNQLAIDNTGRIAEEDYILLRSNGARVSMLRERRIFRDSGWDGNRLHADLSYRYAVAAAVFIGSFR